MSSTPSAQFVLGTAIVLTLVCSGSFGAHPTAQTEEFEPLVTTLGTRSFDVEYELWYYINVVFESRVEKTDTGYEYRYMITNKGDTQVRVEWRSVEESEFGRAATNIEELRPGLLEPGTESEWLVRESTAPPTVSERAARMYASAPSGNEAAEFSGPAPAYIPQ